MSNSKEWFTVDHKGLSDYTMLELLDEIRRREQAVKYKCLCGPKRREITTGEDKVFYARTGCTNCDKWDGPPRLKNP